MFHPFHAKFFVFWGVMHLTSTKFIECTKCKNMTKPHSNIGTFWIPWNNSLNNFEASFISRNMMYFVVFYFVGLGNWITPVWFLTIKEKKYYICLYRYTFFDILHMTNARPPKKQIFCMKWMEHIPMTPNLVNGIHQRHLFVLTYHWF